MRKLRDPSYNWTPNQHIDRAEELLGAAQEASETTDWQGTDNYIEECTQSAIAHALVAISISLHAVVVIRDCIDFKEELP